MRAAIPLLLLSVTCTAEDSGLYRYTLKDGREIRGIYSEAQQVIVMHTEHGVIIANIPKRQIVSIEPVSVEILSVERRVRDQETSERNERMVALVAVPKTISQVVTPSPVTQFAMAPQADYQQPYLAAIPEYEKQLLTLAPRPYIAPRPALAPLDQYDPNSLSNPYGAGSPYKSDGLMNPYSQYGSPYSNQSWTNPYATDAPKLYDQNGKYHGKLSANPYDPDSTSNPYGRYGSKYSPDSVNNPYGAGNPYGNDPIFVYPSR